MRLPSWLDGGAFTGTALGTFASFAAAPVGGLGVLAFLFGGRLVGTALTAGGALLWGAGRRLIER